LSQIFTFAWHRLLADSRLRRLRGKRLSNSAAEQEQQQAADHADPQGGGQYRGKRRFLDRRSFIQA